MPVLVGFRTFRPASSFVSWDTDAAPQSGTFHTRDRCLQVKEVPTTIPFSIIIKKATNFIV